MNMIVRILQDLQARPRFCVRIENPPHLPLIIEDTRVKGPRGDQCISVAHYAEKNGAFACRPEMLFEVRKRGFSIQLSPFYYRDDCQLVEEYSVFFTGRILVVDSASLSDHERFATAWNGRLEAQGYEAAYKKQNKSRRVARR